jgi:hypothetical protein
MRAALLLAIGEVRRRQRRRQQPGTIINLDQHIARGCRHGVCLMG